MAGLLGSLNPASSMCRVTPLLLSIRRERIPGRQCVLTVEDVAIVRVGFFGFRYSRRQYRMREQNSRPFQDVSATKAPYCVFDRHWSLARTAVTGGVCLARL